MHIEFTSSLVPLPDAADVEARATLGDMVERHASEEWVIPFRPIVCDAAAAIDWRITKRGPRVFVPLFPYIVPAGSANSAIGFAFQLAVRFMAEAKSVRRLHIALGEPMENLGQTWRFWLGIGAILR